LDWFRAIAPENLRGIKRGLEKEALRITPEGKLAHTPHPLALGSALTHPHITTDYSEALLEFITPPCDSIDAMLQWLDDIHRFTYAKIHVQDELLWMSSMPCAIDGEDSIPIARYGSSNSARMKEAYRTGLGHRYGRTMQTIAGIHYNFSFPDEFWRQLQQLENYSGALQDYKTGKYFALIRNFRRYFWLMLYLFGAAPAVCPTFVKSRQHNLQPLESHSLHYPFATSLRMGELGYQSKAQASILADYNSLDGYIKSLLGALTTTHPDYARIGVCVNGGYRQLNDHLLQIENEFYSTIRAKRTTRRGETPIRALRQRGVEYIEVRSVDINPFQLLGIDSTQAHFIEAFLLFCLLEDSPPSHAEECKQIAENQRRIVNEGRNPGLEVFCHGNLVNLRLCGKKLLDDVLQAAALLDRAMQTTAYTQAADEQFIKLHDEHKTPSAQMLDVMQESGQSFFRLAYQLSRQHEQYFLQHPLTEDRRRYFELETRESLARQKAIEEADSISFEQYLENYFRQYRE
jgi:glutamate--cysteine ligase